MEDEVEKEIAKNELQNFKDEVKTLETLLRKSLPFVKAARGSKEFIKEIEKQLE